MNAANVPYCSLLAFCLSWSILAVIAQDYPATKCKSAPEMAKKDMASVEVTNVPLEDLDSSTERTALAGFYLVLKLDCTKDGDTFAGKVTSCKLKDSAKTSLLAKAVATATLEANQPSTEVAFETEEADCKMFCHASKRPGFACFRKPLKIEKKKQ